MAPAPDEPERELRSALPVVADPAGELLCRIAERDPTAFESLYRLYARPVYGLALRRLSDREVAEDATQRAFSAVWRSAATYVPGRDDGARWLFTVALSEIGDRPRGESGAEDEWPAFRVHAAVAELPEEERTPLELACWGGRSQTEVAELLGLPLDTVKIRTRRALERLAVHLEGVA